MKAPLGTGSRWREGKQEEGAAGGGGMCLPGLGGCPGPGSRGAMWAGREGLSPPGSRLASVGADCVYTFPTHPAHARLFFSGLSHPWALCTVCTLAASAAESCHPRPGEPLREAARDRGAPSSAHHLLSQQLVGSPCWGWTQCSQKAESFSPPISLERAAAWKWEQESSGAW